MHLENDADGCILRQSVVLQVKASLLYDHVSPTLLLMGGAADKRHNSHDKIAVPEDNSPLQVIWQTSTQDSDQWYRQVGISCTVGTVMLYNQV